MILSHRPIRGRSPALDFDARLVRPLHAGTARHLGRVLLYLAPIAGFAVVLAVWLAKHVGLLSDARAVAPSSTPWLGTFVLFCALWCVVALAAAIIPGVR